jgi:hypothetical protein
MYAGPIGIALAATARRPDVPLAALIAASLLPDLFVVPFWHTIPGAAALVLLAFAVGGWRWDRAAGALLAALVASHFAVDLLTSNLRIWPNRDAELGLGLYDVPVADFGIEAAVILGGWWLWRRAIAGNNDDVARPMAVLLVATQVVFALFIAGSANDEDARAGQWSRRRSATCSTSSIGACSPRLP